MVIASRALLAGLLLPVPGRWGTVPDPEAGRDLINVNLTFADGPGESRSRAQLQWQQSGNWTPFDQGGRNLEWHEFQKDHTIAGETELAVIWDFVERAYGGVA